MKSAHLVLALTLLIAGCQTAPSVARRPSQISQDDVSELQTILAARVGKLDRDVITFHYEDATRSHFRPQSLKDLQNRLTGWPEKFFNPSEVAWNSGPGEYTASDPAASRSFGGINPQLFVFISPKGSVFLDTVTLTSAVDAAVLKRLYTKNRCRYYESPGSRVFTTWFAAFRNNEVQACRELAISAARNLGIQLIFHDELGATNLKDCRRARPYTFNVVSSLAINMGQIAYFDDNLAIDGQNLSPYLSTLFAEAVDDPIIQQLYPIAPPATLTGKVPSDYVQWKKQFIFACGERWNGETSAPPLDVQERLLQTYQNQLVLDAVADTLRAYRRKIPDGTWNLPNLRRIVETQYRVDNPEGHIHFNDWWRALQDLLFTIDDRVVKSAEILKENVPSVGKDEREEAVRNYWAEHPEASPQVVYRALGFSKQSTRFLLNGLWVRLGSAPALGSTLEPSTEMYLDILRQCKKVYLDPKVTREAIEAGPCGFL